MAGRFAERAREIAESIPIDATDIDYSARAVVGVVVAIADLWLGCAGAAPDLRYPRESGG
ncbi:hypothetical protein [Nocardia sp. NPDC051463]|uniref:hypothetical protein n=1 Tax=Nocardia sp. NPDC051463 TaxID=3154845 RepID=UPI0034163F41